MHVANRLVRDNRTALFSTMGCIVLSLVLIGRLRADDNNGPAPVVQAAEEIEQSSSGITRTLTDQQDDTPVFLPEDGPVESPSDDGLAPLINIAPEIEVEAESTDQNQTGTQEEVTEATEIKTERFDGIEPGVTTAEQLNASWGDPVETQNEDGISILVYERSPFAKVDVTVIDGVVDSIVVVLESPADPTALAQQINVSQFTPVPVPDAKGRLLGQVFPERAILFVFNNDSESLQVVQIIIDPISAEPFLLRAKHDFRHRYSQNLADLEFALSLDPEYAEAYSLKARLFAVRGQWGASLTSAREAVRLEPTNVPYQLAAAKAENENGGYAQALEATRRVLDLEDLSDIDRAVAQQQLGDLLAEGPSPDFDKALEFHQRAIESAAPFSTHEEFAVRRIAKRVLVDAHLAVALDIARGNFRNKAEVVQQWLNQADALIDNLVDADNGDSLLRLTALRWRLATQGALPHPADPTAAVRSARILAEQLVQSNDDTDFHETVDCELRIALYHAVRIERARNQFPRAMQYAQDAVGRFEIARAQQGLGPRARIQLGETYYLAGSMQAVGTQNHEAASRLYERALELISEPMPVFALSQSGDQGAWFVSMGVTFWQLDQRERAVRLTSQGMEFMQHAVDAGQLDESALGVPYGNLAAMHRSLGNDGQAENFSELAQRAIQANDGGTQQR